MIIERVVSLCRGVLFLTLCLFICECDVLEAQPIEGVLSAIEVATSEITSIQTTFTQIKKIGALDRELHLSGMICIEKPFTFAWHVREPLVFSLVVQGDAISCWDEDSDKVHSFSMDKNPVLQMVFEQMQSWITGDYASMLGDYDVVKLPGESLILAFTPKEKSLSSGMIAQVVIAFNEDVRYIREIAIYEKSGDASVLTFVDTVLNEAVDKKYWEADARVG